MDKCSICKNPFDNYLRVNCGGDCRVCLAASGDQDCIDSLVNQIERLREALQQIETAWDKYPEHFEKRGETYCLNLLRQIARFALQQKDSE